MKKTAAGTSGGGFGLSPFKEEREESFLLTQVQKFFRIHGLIIVGDAEMDMAAQG